MIDFRIQFPTPYCGKDPSLFLACGRWTPYPWTWEGEKREKMRCREERGESFDFSKFNFSETLIDYLFI